MERPSRGSQEAQVVEGKVFAILSYLSILCIVPLILKKENPFVLSHGKQGLVLLVGEVAVFIISIVFPWLLKLGVFIFGILSFIGILAVLAGRYIKLPIVDGIAAKITL